MKSKDWPRDIAMLTQKRSHVVVLTDWWTYSMLDMNEKTSERNISKAITDGGKWKHSMPKLSLKLNVNSAGQDCCTVLIYCWILPQCVRHVGTSGECPTKSIILYSPQTQKIVACCDRKSSPPCVMSVCARLYVCITHTCMGGATSNDRFWQGLSVCVVSDSTQGVGSTSERRRADWLS